MLSSDATPGGGAREINGGNPMRFYDSFGMNPRTVRFFLLEKGIDLPREEVDILAAENRREPYLSLNPAGQTPLLELDDGTPVAETYAICEYLEEQHPSPALIGSTPAERAVTRMWWRRAEIQICHPMVQAFYYGPGYDIFKDRVYCIPSAAEDMKEKARAGMRWLDGILRGPYLAGDRFTVADICLFCYLDQLGSVGQPIPEDCAALSGWFGCVAERPAANRSVWRDQPMGMRG
jgi:glutathione S-transferase